MHELRLVHTGRQDWVPRLAAIMEALVALSGQKGGVK